MSKFMNLQTPFGFRCLAILSIILDIAGTLVDMVFPSLLPAELQYDMTSVTLPLWMQHHPFLALAVLAPLFLAWLGGFIGLLFFKRWGRSLSLYFTFIRIGLALLAWETSYFSALAFALDITSSTLWGGVLALAYYSPIAQWFGDERLRVHDDSAFTAPRPAAETRSEQHPPGE
jgi:hypothetical protein